MNSRPFGKARDARVAGLTCPRPPACQAGPRPRTRLSRDCRCFSPLGLVALSLLRGGSGRIPASRARRERGDGRGPRLTKMRIFVVEDEERVACSLQALLLDSGHTPLVVPCVDLALDRFEATPPDAVLLSLHYYFPGMSGFDFLQRERVRESNVPIITLSASPTESEARESLRLGALDNVGKEVSPDLLRGVLAYLELHATGDRVGGTGTGPARRRIGRHRPARCPHSLGARPSGSIDSTHCVSPRFEVQQLAAVVAAASLTTRAPSHSSRPTVPIFIGSVAWRLRHEVSPVPVRAPPRPRSAWNVEPDWR